MKSTYHGDEQLVDHLIVEVGPLRKLFKFMLSRLNYWLKTSNKCYKHFKIKISSCLSFESLLHHDKSNTYLIWDLANKLCRHCSL